jgi:hypothetical protein
MQPSPATECQERKILEGRYRADFKVYTSAVHTLEESLGTEDFKQNYQNADLAKRAFDRARDALESHIATHGCSSLIDG